MLYLSIIHLNVLPSKTACIIGQSLCASAHLYLRVSLVKRDHTADLYHTISRCPSVVGP